MLKGRIVDAAGGTAFAIDGVDRAARRLRRRRPGRRRRGRSSASGPSTSAIRRRRRRACPAVIDIDEPMGSDSLLWLTFAGQPLSARTTADHALLATASRCSSPSTPARGSLFDADERQPHLTIRLIRPYRARGGAADPCCYEPTLKQRGAAPATTGADGFTGRDYLIRTFRSSSTARRNFPPLDDVLEPRRPSSATSRSEELWRRSTARWAAASAMPRQAGWRCANRPTSSCSARRSSTA